MTSNGKTQTENLLDLFRTHGDRLSTAFLSSDAVHGLIGTKYTGRISDLRKRGYVIEDLGDQGNGNHIYELVEKDLGGGTTEQGIDGPRSDQDIRHPPPSLSENKPYFEGKQAVFNLGV